MKGQKCRYVRSLRDKSVRRLRSIGTSAYEKAAKDYDLASEENDRIMRELFTELQEGNISCFYTCRTNTRRNGSRYTSYSVYHRSTKENGCVQGSYFYTEDNGMLIPLGDSQFREFEEFRSYGYRSGAYLIRESA